VDERESDSGSDLSFVAEKYWTATISSRLRGSRILSASANICKHAQPCLACIQYGSASGTNSVKLALYQGTSNRHSQQFESQRNNQSKVLFRAVGYLAYSFI